MKKGNNSTELRNKLAEIIRKNSERSQSLKKMLKALEENRKLKKSSNQ